MMTDVSPLLLDCKTAARLIGVGLSTFYAMDRSGELGPPGLRLRRRIVQTVADYQRGRKQRPRSRRCAEVKGRR